MARKRRIEYEGALYHVLARGNQRQKIFHSSHDYSRYLDLLSQYKKRYRFSLYAYALMPNHVHLMIETAEVPLSKILQGLNQSYTIYFNRKHETVGHLFQGRYKAILCDRDEYLLTLIKYIHLNPVRSRLVKIPNEYHWTSHHLYERSAPDGLFVDTQTVLQLFSKHKPIAVKRYIEFMNCGPAIDKKKIYETVDQRVLGDEQFVADVRTKISANITGDRRKRQYSLEEIAVAIEKTTSVSVAMLRTPAKARIVADARRLFCQAAREYAYRNHEIACFLAKDAASITRYFKEQPVPTALLDRVHDTLKD